MSALPQISHLAGTPAAVAALGGAGTEGPGPGDFLVKHWSTGFPSFPSFPSFESFPSAAFPPSAALAFPSSFPSFPSPRPSVDFAGSPPPPAFAPSPGLTDGLGKRDDLRQWVADFLTPTQIISWYYVVSGPRAQHVFLGGEEIYYTQNPRIECRIECQSMSNRMSGFMPKKMSDRMSEYYSR